MKIFWKYVGSSLRLVAIISLLFQTTYGKETGFSFRKGVSQIKVPIEVQNNLILIPIRINGSFEMNFILDTGVRTTILTEPVIANFLEIDSTETISVRGLGEGNAIEASLARNVSMDLPGIIGRGINMVILPQGLVSYSELFGKPVYGIIGFELFRSFVVEIDYNKKFAKFSSPFKYKPKKSWDKVPIQIRRGKPYVMAQFLSPDGEKMNTSWLIDTGSSQALSLFYEDMSSPDPSIYTLLGQGLNGSIYGKLARIERFSLGSYKFSSVVSAFPDPEALGLRGEEKLRWYGNIGSDILSRFRFIINYQRGQMYIKKGSKFRKPFEYNLSGVEVIAKGVTFSDFMVSYVRPNSPAARSGLQEGDEILRINGIEADELEIGELYGMINKKAGRRVSLVVKRQTKSFRCNFVLEQEI